MLFQYGKKDAEIYILKEEEGEKVDLFHL